MNLPPIPKETLLIVVAAAVAIATIIWAPYFFQLQLAVVIENQDRNYNATIEAIEILSKGQDRANVRGNITLDKIQDMNHSLIMQAEQEANLTKEETERLVDDLQKIPTLIDDVAKIEETLTQGQSAVLENITSQLDKLVTAPPVASQDRQIINFRGIQELLRAHNLTLKVDNITTASN